MARRREVHDWRAEQAAPDSPYRPKLRKQFEILAEKP